MPEADETIVIQYLVKGDAAMRELAELRRATNDAKQQMIEFAAYSGKSLDDIARAMKNVKYKELLGEAKTLSREGSEAFKRYAYAVTQAQNEIKSATSSTKVFGVEIGNMGDIAKFVFGSVLGVTAVTVLRNIINYFKEAAVAGREFAESVVKLSVSTRALQRVGMDVTFKGAVEQAKALREEFGLFTQQEAVEGIAQIQLLTRNFNFSQEQMQNTARAAAAMAAILGKDFNEAAREVALFMSSGYAESMQRAGFAVNRVTVQQKALEMGINKSYTQMTEAERAGAAYALIMEQIGAVMEDATKIQDTQTGSITKSEKAIEDYKRQIGEAFVPVWEKVLEVLVGAINFISRMDEAWKALNATMTSVASGGLAAVTVLFAQLKEGRFDPQEIMDSFKGVQKAVRDTIYEAQKLGQFRDQIEDPFEGISIGAQNAKDAVDELSSVMEDFEKDVEEEQERYQSQMEKLARDLQDDLAKIERDGARERADIVRDYARDIAKIYRDSYAKIEEENLKYQLDRAQLIRSFDNKISDANKKYQDKELKAEKDFQEKMLRLREKFLFDLEDALRERDAKQVLNLIRRYNLEKAQLERQRDQDKQDRADDLKDELQEIADDRAERLRILEEEHQFRLEAIQRQTQRELDERKIKLAQELADLQRSLEEKAEERRIKYEEQMRELDIQTSERLQKLVEAYVEEQGLTAEYARSVYDILAQYFGPGGLIDGVYDHFMQTIQEMNAQMTALQASVASGPLYTTPGNPNYPAHQAGGSFYAASPTLVQYGEVPEIATFTPISQLNTRSMSPLGGKGGMGGKGTLEIRLSDGLEASIIDNTLTQASGIIVDIMRSK